MKRAIIFANGDLNPGPAVDAILNECETCALIGADGGARHLLALDLAPALVIGDMDSLTDAQIAQCEARGASVLRHPPEKDETDLELALLHVAELGAAWVRIIGAMGNRLDQLLANVLLLTLPALSGCDVRLVAGRQTAWLLKPGTHAVTGAAGDTLSLIPLGGAAEGVTTQGLAYPLKDETLAFGPARGVSNVMAGDSASVRVAEGLLLAVHTLGRA
jgi:thiamine pyrophosphokinase